MTILVTGATGNVGRLVVDELLGRGAPVRALTVDPERAALPGGVEVVVGSLARPSTLPAALNGVESVYLAPMGRTVTRFCELAAEAGIPRVVALSGASVGQEHEGSSGHEFAAVERAVRAAGFDRTFLRPGMFMANTLGWAPSVRESGVVRSAYGDAVQTPIDLRDIAAAAAQVLVTDGHSGRTYVLSGPQTVTRREMAAAIGSALGRELPFVELTPAEQRAEWVSVGIPPLIADWMLDGFADSRAERPEPTGVFEELVGRPGTTYAEWAVANVAAFGG
ncbi:NAD(P)H-binding protein [Amycolatopsis sp. PS_44_ISF1]|uniref:NAD(P)H-binding protein n=1 Tax=Amycolatopsis sp. PS_44_ISF1 TaxID=2974917 RepID=UPI0028DF360B|nr:NAD(P)H-binding protein [Amycolatopsis sp. PS_44_ISF1]MDT8914868.1 NAD(P)H-binding protein [Amycolatopsis sp. PS_44_ISF1]